MTLLTDAQRAALTAFRATWDAFETTTADSEKAEAVLEAINWPFTGEDSFAYRLYDIGGWLLATDARLRAQSAADAALLRIGAAWYTGLDDAARAAWIAATNAMTQAERDAMYARAEALTEGGGNG